jgi:hypothetical protein
MTNNNYKRGYNLERNVKLYFESLGYVATRAAGSHGKYDVWATDGESLILVQCKIGATVAYAERLLKEMADEFFVSFDTATIPVDFSVVIGMSRGAPIVLAGVNEWRPVKARKG